MVKRARNAPTPPEPQEKQYVPVNSAQIAAAKLQMTLDRKFGRATSPIVRKIAEAKPLPPEVMARLTASGEFDGEPR